jgi:uncharacterized protein YutE (UPF0331/DUF86 family)
MDYYKKTSEFGTFLQQVADRYRSEGYRVSMAAGLGALPAEIDSQREHIDLIAQKDGTYVAVTVKRRDQLYEINPLKALVQQQLPDWSFDLVVYPPSGVDEIPLEDGEPSLEYVESLLAEAQRLLDFGTPRAAFLVAWSAIESSMRTAARREDLDIEEGVPRFVLKTLYSNGVISYEDYERVRLCLDKRNRLVHGLPVDHLEPDNVRFMIDFARQILCDATAPADA